MPRVESVLLGGDDSVPQGKGWAGDTAFFSPSPDPRGGLGRMQRPGLPQAGQPPHPPTSSGHRLGRDWGHQVSTGMHHREQCPAEASFPDPTEKEPPPR